MPIKKSTFLSKLKKRSSSLKKVTTLTRKRAKGRDYTEQDASDLDITCRVTEENNLEFTTRGRWVSLNFVMARAHWASDTDVVSIIKRKVRQAVKDIDIWITRYRIEIRYNSKLDDHNCVMMPKYFTDAIKFNYEKTSRGRYVAGAGGEKIIEFKGLIPDDDKRYSRGTSFFPDESLPHNTYIMTYINDSRETDIQRIPSITGGSKRVRTKPKDSQDIH